MKNKILTKLIMIICLSLLAEVIILFYNFAINKIYKKVHLTENETIGISKENLEIEIDGDISKIKVKNIDKVKIYNISLAMNGKNQDVYLRVMFNNDAKFMPKENVDATKFKVYFFEGMQTDEFSIVFPKDQINIENIKEVLINDNIDYLPEVKISFQQIVAIAMIFTTVYLFIELYKFSEKKERKIKKEFIFLILSSIIGITFIIINVPQVRYDEHAHFWRAYELSQGYIVSKTTHELPKSIINLFVDENGQYPNRTINYETIKNKINDKLNPEDKQQFAVGATGSLTPISYIPQVIGVTIGRILNLSPILILTLGRLTNLIVYIALIFIAIKIIPNERWKALIMIIALLPMSMDLAATLSPDTVILGNTLLAISYFLHLKFECEKISLKQVSILGILIMIPTLCKIVYFPLLLIFFMLPKEKFGSKVKKIVYSICMLAIIFIPYICFKNLNSTGDVEIAIRTNMTEQILFTFSDIVRDFNIAINTFYSESSNYLFEVIGGWNTINIVSIIIFIMILVVMFRKYPNQEKFKFEKKDNIIVSIIVLIETLGIIAAMYLGWTQAKQTVVEGIQGRYFLPVIPLLAIFLSKNKIEWNIKNKEIKYVFVTTILYFIIFIFSVGTYC